MQLYYGIENYLRDITNIVLGDISSTGLSEMIVIPASDNARANIFGDHLPGILKKIVIIHDSGEHTDYSNEYIIKINTKTNEVYAIHNTYIEQKLVAIQSPMILHHGSFSEEVPEQKMAVAYLTGKEKVLEIGGNIGRNSLVIASIIKTAGNGGALVSLECSPSIAEQLTENRDANHFDFPIEKAALSNRKLMQIGWETFPIDNGVIPNGYTEVDTISLAELKQKYAIDFDTLVLDCEGAFYYILMDMPEILRDIQIIIMENDYHDITHKQYVNKVMIENGFYRDYVEGGGWGPCENYFFEVWKKTV